MFSSLYEVQMSFEELFVTTCILASTRPKSSQISQQMFLVRKAPRVVESPQKFAEALLLEDHLEEQL